MTDTLVYLSLGSNLGDRRMNLEQALAMLADTAGITLTRVSSAYVTEALLPKGLSATQVRDWNTPFINLAAEVRTQLTPAQLLQATQAVEHAIGRRPADRWAPRVLDVDIILYGNQTLATEDLCIPHPHAAERAFVLGPLCELNPTLRLPGYDGTILKLLRQLNDPLPAWMQIVNVTPDSFSGDGRLLADLSALPACNYIDIGAESTRPHAPEVSPQEEWARLEPVLATIPWSNRVRPRISIDTRHASTAQRAIELGVDMINDVSGLRDPAMREVLRTANCEIVTMHALSIPANPSQLLAEDVDAVTTVCAFFHQQLEELDQLGLGPDRLVIDPGIGFGKTAAQSWALLRATDEIMSLGCRVLYGHSRKSFLASMTDADAAQRDAETLGISLALAQRGIDIIRVHDVPTHQRLWRAYCKTGPASLS